MGRPFLMGGLASLAAGSARLLGGKFMGCPFLVRRLASFTGDLPLFFFFHGAETTVAFACHASVLSKQGGKDVVRTIFTNSNSPITLDGHTPYLMYQSLQK
jgi:hypothetical protein